MSISSPFPDARLASLAILFAAILLSASADEPEKDTSTMQTIYRAGSQESYQAPDTYFTGNAFVQILFPANDTAQFSGAYVTFEPGARSAWHLHPAGQHLVVTDGVGRTGYEDGTVEEIRKGDVIWCPPGVKHWHGAAPDSCMTHLALSGKLDGKSVEWFEKVTDEEYGGTVTLAADALTPREQAIIPIAAFTATGELDRLKPALVSGLEAGLTVNEIKEILVHLYAYTGFPRSLNGIITFMNLMNERQAAGIKDTVGADASPVPADMDRDAHGARVRATLVGLKEIPPPTAYQVFVPIIDTFLKEHLFADIFARDVLNHQTRELVTVATLAAMDGTEPQLKSHLKVSMNIGLTEAQLQAMIAVLRAKVDPAKASSAAAALQAVVSDGKQ